MPHMHRIVRPRRDFESAVASAHPLPDPDHPLIDRDHSAEFVRPLDDGRRVTGTVFAQWRTLEKREYHRLQFYIEFPTDSGSFHEISTTRMVHFLGYQPPRNRFDPENVAHLLEQLHPSTDVTTVFKAAKPN